MMTRRQLIWVVVLVVAVVMSAVGVIYAKYNSRHLFIHQGTLRKELDQMAIDWGRLQLEQSTWASLSRIEKEAYLLNMRMVKADEVNVVRSPK
jgi:cell division protein FtsL